MPEGRLGATAQGHLRKEDDFGCCRNERNRVSNAPTYEHPWEDPMSCNEIIGPAKPGYKRSLALIHQINVINSNLGIDYHIMPADSSKQPLALVLQDFAAKFFFRRARAHAMESGDRDAVAAMAQLLARRQDAFSKAEVYSQLSKEYEFDVGDAVAELDRRCAQEAGGLSKLEFETQDFMATTRELFTNSALKKERDQILRTVAASLTGRSDSK